MISGLRTIRGMMRNIFAISGSSVVQVVPYAELFKALAMCGQIYQVISSQRVICSASLAEITDTKEITQDCSFMLKLFNGKLINFLSAQFSWPHFLLFLSLLVGLGVSGSFQSKR